MKLVFYNLRTNGSFPTVAYSIEQSAAKKKIAFKWYSTVLNSALEIFYVEQAYLVLKSVWITLMKENFLSLSFAYCTRCLFCLFSKTDMICKFQTGDNQWKNWQIDFEMNSYLCEIWVLQHSKTLVLLLICRCRSMNFSNHHTTC